MNNGRNLAPALLLAGLAGGMAIGLSAAWLTWSPPIPTAMGHLRTVNIRSVADLESRLRANDYALAAVRRGEAAVPRLFLRRLPDDWREIEDPRQRKQRFIAAVLPLALAVNEAVAADRKRLLALTAPSAPPLAAADSAWIDALARRYGARPNRLGTLRRRVNVVPPSLTLAQAAVESGWGTSRFATQGNALFGQRIWNDGPGMAPQDRDPDASFQVRAFRSLADSVAAYIHNLNTHRAYRELRNLRETAGKGDLVPAGNILATALTRYSERGVDYVNDLLQIIRTNGLTQFDSATLMSAGAGARISARDIVILADKQGTSP